MVTLDYRTYNRRWKLKGIRFKSWESYSFTLGYLSNPAHYDNVYPRVSNADISIHIEMNDEQGAWGKEGRIHYYGPLHRLRVVFRDLYDCSSAGNGRKTRRINSNGYILSLIDDYGFEVQRYPGYTTTDVFPADVGRVEALLKDYLRDEGLSGAQIDSCLEHFDAGYGL